MKKTESKSFINILVSGIIASLGGLVVTLMLTLLFSLLISSGYFSESASEFAYLTAVPGALLAGMLCAKAAGRKMLFFGLLGGALFYLLLLAVSSLSLPSLPLTGRAFTVLAACMSGSVIGAMLAPKR